MTPGSRKSLTAQSPDCTPSPDARTRAVLPLCDAWCGPENPAEAGTARTRSSIVSASSLMEAASVSNPIGPPSNFSMIEHQHAAVDCRSRPNARSPSSRDSASPATSTVITLSAITLLQVQHESQELLVRLSEFLETAASIPVIPASSASIAMIRADRATIFRMTASS